MKKSVALGISRSGGTRDPHVTQYTLRLLVSSVRLAPSGLRSVSFPTKRSCAPAERDLPSLTTIFSQALREIIEPRTNTSFFTDTRA
ncbi:MAG: hypothetical protein ACREYE_32730 [Gammaproteobacteria bacterium]